MSGPVIEQPKKKRGRPAKKKLDGPAKSPKVAKNSQPAEQSRAEKATRGPRVPMGAGGRVAVPKPIVDEIKAKGYVPRMCLDDGEGRIDQYVGAYWEFYLDADGHKFTRPAGSGRTHILMMLPRKYKEEDDALKRQKNNAILASKAKLEKGPGFQEYVPEGHEYVVSSDL